MRRQQSCAPAKAAFTVSMTLIWLVNLMMMHLCGSYDESFGRNEIQNLINLGQMNIN